MGNLVMQAQVKYRSLIESAQEEVNSITKEISASNNKIAGYNNEINSLNNSKATILATIREYENNFKVAKDCNASNLSANREKNCNRWLDKRNVEREKLNNIEPTIASKQKQISAEQSHKAQLTKELTSAKDNLNMITVEANKAVADAQKLETQQFESETRAANTSNPLYLQAQNEAERNRQNAELQRQIEADKAKNLAVIEQEKIESKKETNKILLIVAGICIVVAAVAAVILFRKR